jgi:hypothetical protein
MSEEATVKGEEVDVKEDLKSLPSLNLSIQTENLDNEDYDEDEDDDISEIHRLEAEDIISSSLSSRGKWSEAEDEILRNAVQVKIKLY